MKADRVTRRASKTSQIGIFGGSFNPPHTAHLIIAEVVREQFDLDQILWIPNRQSPFKDRRELASADDRLEMTRLAVNGNQSFATSDVEVKRSGLSYMVDTIRHLQDENTAAGFHLIIGSDSLVGFPSWHEPKEIARRVQIIVFPRPGSDTLPIPGEFHGRISIATAPLLEISSTEIRRRLRQGRSIRYMVPQTVHDYIVERGLYA